MPLLLSPSQAEHHVPALDVAVVQHHMEAAAGPPFGEAYSARASGSTARTVAGTLQRATLNARRSAASTINAASPSGVSQQQRADVPHSTHAASCGVSSHA